MGPLILKYILKSKFWQIPRPSKNYLLQGDSTGHHNEILVLCVHLQYSQKLESVDHFSGPETVIKHIATEQELRLVVLQ